MAEHHSGDGIEPGVASHLAKTMDEAPGPEPAQRLPLPASEIQQWPDGSGKHRHAKEHDAKHGRPGQDAAVNAVHRTGKPDVPHSS